MKSLTGENLDQLWAEWEQVLRTIDRLAVLKQTLSHSEYRSLVDRAFQRKRNVLARLSAQIPLTRRERAFVQSSGARSGYEEL